MVQSLTDFIAEFTDNIASNLDTEVPDEQEVKNSDITRWKLFVDGSSNQHGCSVGLVLQIPSGEQMKYVIRIGFKATNNKVEYEALLVGFKVATGLKVEFLDSYNDTQLVVNQVQGDYLPKDLHIMAYLDEVKAMEMKIKDFKILQIPREENKKADALANLASAMDFISNKNVPLEFLSNPSIDVAKIVYQSTNRTDMDGWHRHISQN